MPSLRMRAALSASFAGLEISGACVVSLGVADWLTHFTHGFSPGILLYGHDCLGYADR